jgi:hypothetical protein
MKIDHLQRLISIQSKEIQYRTNELWLDDFFNLSYTDFSSIFVFIISAGRN